MAQLGDIKRARDLGYKLSDRKDGKKKYVWHACIYCGRERWVRIRNGKPAYEQCIFCKNQKSRRGYNGRIWIKLTPDHPFFSMARKDGYVFKHRLIMAKHLGRCLQSKEVIHHINGNILDNSLSNLQLFQSSVEHLAFHRKLKLQT